MTRHFITFRLIPAILPLLAQVAYAQRASGFKWLKWDPSKRQGQLEVFDPNRPSYRYRLSPVNRTATIWSAYQADSIIVVLGQMDSDIGEIVTGIDANSKRELMEFLCYDAQPSESGLKIAFRHFYPHFGTADLSDRVQIIYLSQGLPSLSPSADFHVPPENAGRTVYPQMSVPTGIRHRVQNFLWATGDSTLFFIDRLERVVPGNVEPQELCLVRVDQITSSSPRVARKCLDSRALGDDSITSIWPKNFHRDAAGGLVLSLELRNASIESSSRDYNVDPATLNVSPVQKLNDNYLPIPWRVQKKQLIAFTPLMRSDRLQPYEQEVVGIKLTIGTNGAVERGELSDALPDSVRGDVLGAITRWQFRPTILNGKLTKVVTSFEVELGHLEDSGWKLKDE